MEESKRQDQFGKMIPNKVPNRFSSLISKWDKKGKDNYNKSHIDYKDYSNKNSKIWWKSINYLQLLIQIQNLIKWKNNTKW